MVSKFTCSVSSWAAGIIPIPIVVAIAVADWLDKIITAAKNTLSPFVIRFLLCI